MSNRHAGVAAVLLLACTSACSRQPSAASQPAPQTMAQATEDSLAAVQLAQARADSIAHAAELARAAARTRADSVREQVVGETAAEPALTRWGLAGPDSMGVADRLHFDFDMADLSADDLRKLEIKRQVLAAHPELRIEIAGNADERGADEYNLALGLRRAAAAHRWLVAHGIDASRISIVSYGEERPLNPGHDEVAWKQNRRADFLVTRPAN